MKRLILLLVNWYLKYLNVIIILDRVWICIEVNLLLNAMLLINKLDR